MANIFDPTFYTPAGTPKVNHLVSHGGLSSTPTLVHTFAAADLATDAVLYLCPLSNGQRIRKLEAVWEDLDTDVSATLDADFVVLGTSTTPDPVVYNAGAAFAAPGTIDLIDPLETNVQSGTAPGGAIAHLVLRINTAAATAGTGNKLRLLLHLN